MPVLPRSHDLLGYDARLLFATQAVRMFAYGFLSVVLVLYLAGLGFSEGRIGLLLTLTLAGVPFFLAGGLKILYDLLLYRSFKAADLGATGKED